MQKSLNAEYGPLTKLPGMFGRPDTLLAFDPEDFARIYRTEGIWPTRRGMETFTYYRKQVRPDLFHNMGGLLTEQGKDWSDLRSKVNPVMLQPKTVKLYIPSIDEVAVDFLSQVVAKRDANNELPADFNSGLTKWALESIGVIALNRRLGVLTDHNPQANALMQSVRDFFALMFELEVKPSLWRYVSTPMFKELMKTFDVMTRWVLSILVPPNNNNNN